MVYSNYRSHTILKVKMRSSKYLYHLKKKAQRDEMDSISVKYHANQNGFMIRKRVSVADFLRVEEKQI